MVSSRKKAGTLPSAEQDRDRCVKAGSVNRVSGVDEDEGR